MEYNRIKKLIKLEYKELSDEILVESPFAQTTRNGKGLREVALGLTSTMLLIASDSFNENNNFIYPSNVDPSIETLQLICIYPLEMINLSVFHRRRRKTLKAKLCNGQDNYYELGGMKKKELLWNLWCQQVEIILSQKNNSSSLSETTVASSPSVTTHYYFSSDFDSEYYLFNKLQGKKKTLKNKIEEKPSKRWTTKDIYFGSSYNEFNPNYYTPIPLKLPDVNIQQLRNEFIPFPMNLNFEDDFKKNTKRLTDENCKNRLSRFGYGVNENCSTILHLSMSNKDRYKLNENISIRSLIDSGVKIWELYKNNKSYKNLRKYALSTAPHFLYAFGPWKIQPGDKNSLQMRKTLSSTNIQKIDAIELSPLSKKKLTSTVSEKFLSQQLIQLSSFSSPCKNSIILFWTPEYWYKPKPASAIYQEIRNYFNQLKQFQDIKNKKNFFRNKHSNERNNSVRYQDKFINKLEKSLRMNVDINILDLDSSTISKQLTLIDRDFFIRISVMEIKALVFEKSSIYSPNFAAWIAFSHRISSLFTSEILKFDELKMRVRTIVRLINAAEKSFTMGNFHSCKSILSSLQSPPIYRLKSTWIYIKKHHATKYEKMMQLCLLFKNVRTKNYQIVWDKSQEFPPSIPYVGHIIIKILNLYQLKTSEQYSIISFDKYENGKTKHFQNLLSNFIRWILESQRYAKQYEFCVIPITRDFLLKAHYKEDKENFFISQILENNM